ncbi:hypothetical protein [Alicyclobacillus sp. SO9]|uniref:hypothetical protein n=1 Tax=Alicyclobacillus sp. SO9 TaxID=2665646 RepID=UPI0018E7443D|nr:hypothetical protein [Alicyclobacillus sp. SO9]QQE79903.1 hypothetical protein GI364_05320 [Alicyclobacillus sp. SO9]
MIALHSIIGLILIVFMLWIVFQHLRGGTAGMDSKRNRMAFIGLLDLQVLLGLITYIIHHPGGWFLFHPLLMLTAVVILHIYTKDTRTKRTQVQAYVWAGVLMIAGMIMGLV